jgi:hypothetical protein
MPQTIQLVETLCTVSQDDLPNPEMYANQEHHHTFTCTERGETSYRFNIQHWPMNETRELLPMAKDDNCRSNYQSKAKKLWQLLEEKRYNSLGEFLVDANSTMSHYLDIIRATLRRPTLVFKRNMKEIYTNIFHPWNRS